MVKGATGPVTSALPLFALPLAGAALLPSGQFAMWSILGSISTLALSLDFGGPAYLASRLDPRNRNKPFIAATAMTCIGTAAVGLLSMCAWIPFSRTDAGESFPFLSGVGAIATITCGSALRSVIQLQAQVALFDRRFVLRNTLLLVHAATALAIALLLLITERTAWALPIAWLVAGVAGCVIGSVVLIRPVHRHLDTDWQIETAGVASVKTYAWARTIANVLRGFLMQADRWIVGAIGGPSVLAAYEIAWRVAALPRFLAENLTFIVGLDAARVRASSDAELTASVTYSMRFTAILLAAVSAGAALLYALLPSITGINIAWAAFLLLLVTHGAVATAAPISFVGNGIGIPTIDLPYLCLSVAICIVSAIFAEMTGQVYVFIGGTTAAMLVGNIWFVVYGLKRLREATRPAI